MKVVCFAGIVLIIVGVVRASDASKLRICVVDGVGNYRVSDRYCPVLEWSENSPAECVIGTDSLDCLRRISKKRADFAVVAPEDLLIAKNLNLEILVTNELRHVDRPYEYELVAVINNYSGIKTMDDLRGKNLCHLGYGFEKEMNPILSNFFEAATVPLKCEDDLTLFENRVRSTSEFFGNACKAGPWASDEKVDFYLKRKYSNLCAICDNPRECSDRDKYWGRRGALFCLTDGTGDIAYARLDDAMNHFGMTSQLRMAEPEDYSFLCRDGTIQPINSASKPCVWGAKPWQVIGSHINKAEVVQSLFNNQSTAEDSEWKSALWDLMEFYNFETHTVDPIGNLDNYLSEATGFLSANSYSSCRPPHTVKLCTSNRMDYSKCSWLSEVAIVQGIEPKLECVYIGLANSTEDCFQALKGQFADVALASADLHMKAIGDYDLEPLFYELTKPEDLYQTVAIVRATDDPISLYYEDFRQKRACFPYRDGVAWNSVYDTFKKLGLLNADDCKRDFNGFFSKIIAPNNTERFSGDSGAFRCLAEKAGDVAFVRMSTLKNLTDGNSSERWAYLLKSRDYHIICLNSSQCSMTWAYPIVAYVSKLTSPVHQKEIFHVFKQIDEKFGKDFKSTRPTFTLYGPFGGQSNVLFDDKTEALVTDEMFTNRQNLPVSYRDVVRSLLSCKKNNASLVISPSAIFFALIVLIGRWFC